MEADAAERMEAASRLLDEGRRWLRADAVDRARACFERAVEVYPLPTALNNLAVIHLDVDAQPERALAGLAPNLAAPRSATWTGDASTCGEPSRNTSRAGASRGLLATAKSGASTPR